MTERYFVATPIAGDCAQLAGDEARHLISVMRAKSGDEVTLFDGSGNEFAAVIRALSKHTVELGVGPPRAVSRELPFDLTLAVALPKGDRQKWLVEKGTELGVTRIIPLITERGVAQPVESALERLRRGVIEASKQCGRNRLLEIAAPQATVACFGSVTGARFLADPTGANLPATQPEPATRITVAIGPEGGFTPHELAAAAENAWQPVSLGPRILRIETAALALAAYFTLQQPPSSH